MRYIMITLIALTAFGAYGCAPSQNRNAAGSCAGSARKLMGNRAGALGYIAFSAAAWFK
jgi:hypothetical protein